ncbi:hypothetical protein FRC04_001390 [Tulasnella sp. 424]|nr:hypothetical protein FRC04_001390 [Tulasnella sp. 424]KAG8968828.1 hypothetical protein FRC05_001314 [Tulasnella sp. 425]
MLDKKALSGSATDSPTNAPELGGGLLALNGVEEITGLEALTISEPLEPKPPFPNLPIEVFLKIIQYALDEIASGSYTAYYVALLSLRAVSKRWAEVMDDSPELWTKVPVDCPEELVEMAIKKSKGRPLDVEGCRGTSSIAARVEAEAHRWRTLKLGTGVSLDIFRNLLSQPAPLLEVLDVTSPPSMDLTIPMFNDSVPSIRVINIRHCHLPWDSPNISNLQRFSMHVIEFEVPSLGELLDILRRSPHLAHLHISRSRIEMPFPSLLSPRVRLPCLQTLILEHLWPGVLNSLLCSIEVPLETSCTVHEALDSRRPLEEGVTQMSERLDSLWLIPQTEPSVLALEASDEEIHELVDLWGRMDTELRYFTRGRSNAHLVLRVTAPPERHIDVLQLFANRLKFSSQSWSPELRLTNMFQWKSPHINKTIDLLNTLSQALPGVRTLTLVDTTDRVERATDVLKQLFPPDSRTTRLFPQLTELTIQANLHNPWVHSLTALGTSLIKSEGSSHLPLDRLQLRGGSISREDMELLRAVVPCLLLDDVTVR